MSTTLRVVKRCAHAGLRREMHDRVDGLPLEHALQEGSVIDVLGRRGWNSCIYREGEGGPTYVPPAEAIANKTGIAGGEDAHAKSSR